MSTNAQRRGARGGRVRADETGYDQGSYYKQNGPMDMFPGSGYTEDPAIHSTDKDPQDVRPPEGEVPDPGAAVDRNDDERNRVLTSPLPLVVSAPEAVDKMKGINE